MTKNITMKKILLLIWVSVMCICQIHAQRIAGMTPIGGTCGLGTIFTINADGTEHQILKEYLFEEGINPARQEIIEGSNGKLYGMTERGGIDDKGVIFQVNKDGSSYTILKHFTSGTSDGKYPNGNLIEGNDGKLYGMTKNGGSNDKGVIFQVNKDGSSYTIIRHFAGGTSDGQNPYGSLMEDSNGKLYGMTVEGGSNNYGVIFQVNKDGSSYTIIRHFAGGTNDGKYPFGNVIEGSDGKLYGMTSQGGNDSNGVVFQVNKDGGSYTILKHFLVEISDGQNPYGSLIEGNDGKLYGMTKNGGSHNGGVLFQMNKDGSSYKILKHFFGKNIFQGIEDGQNPYGSLIEGNDGKLYGMTFQGGSHEYGVLFQVNKDGSSYTILKHFLGKYNLEEIVDAQYPYGSLIEGSDGKLYGMTSQGGSSNRGVVFQVDKDGGSYTILKHFLVEISDGQNPYGSLIEGGDGKLYGMTVEGGNSNSGVIFQLNKDGSSYTILKHFSVGTSDGSLPVGSLVEGNDGKLYGMTSRGGSSNKGVIFQLNKDGSYYTILKHFAGGTSDGEYPFGSLVEGSDGKLYGMTLGGGSIHSGIIFQLNKDGSSYTILIHFLKQYFEEGKEDGQHPYGRLVEGSDGKLYGMTSRGGSSNKGVIFQLNKDGSYYKILKHFFGKYNHEGIEDGQNPYGSLIEGSDGKLYGMTQVGGSNDNGVIFRLNKDGSSYTIIKNFWGGIEGENPFGSLIEGVDRKLYGMTMNGGINN
jgi:uncharacterized repeat protein (TIGR03803 family)